MVRRQWWFRSGPAGALYRVPPRDPAWVRRDELDQVTGVLLKRGATGVPVALLGEGGSGKTALAIDVCNLDRVRRYFSGGVFWVTIGRDGTAADEAAAVRELIGEIGDERPAPPGTEWMARRLGEVLGGRPGRKLIVVDGVRDRLTLFDFAADKSRLLLITREPAAPPIGSVRIPVGRMAQPVAAEVLTRGLPSVREEHVARLVALTGGRALSLALLNRRLADDVARGTAVDTAAGRAVARLGRAGAPDIREIAVGEVVEYSLEVLGVRDRFLELGVFPEDVEVPTSVIALLWRGSGLTAEQSGELCDRLGGLSLIGRGRFGEPMLHAVVQDYARSEDGLGPAGTAAAHRRLIDQLRGSPPVAGGPDTAWWDLPPDEGYLRNHLAYHLHGGGRSQEFTALARDLRWIDARLHRDGPLALASDLRLCDAPGTAGLARLMARSGHLLGDLGAESLSSGNRLTHLGELPEFADRLQESGIPFLSPVWPLPEIPHPVGYRRTGHFGISAVAVSPDGSWLAGAGRDGRVRLWGVDGDQRVMSAEHDGEVSAVAVAPDGSWLVSGGEDATLRLWGTDGDERGVLRHDSGISAVAVSPDGSWLVGGDRGGTVRLWGTDGDERGVLVGHEGGVHAVAVAPDGSWLVSGGRDGTLRLWGADGGERGVLTGHDGPVCAVAVAPDGTWLVSGGWDGTLRLWGADGSAQGVVTGHRRMVSAVAVSPDGSWLVSGGWDGTVRLWGADGGAREVLAGHGDAVEAVAVAPDGSWLVSAGYDGMVRLWGADGSERRVLKGYSDGVHAVAVSPDGSWFAVGGAVGTVRLWGVAGCASPVLHGHPALVSAVAVAPDGSWLVSAGWSKTPQLWWADGTKRGVLAGHASFAGSVAVSPDGSWLVSAGGDGTVRLWGADGDERGVLTGHQGMVNAVAVSPDGSWLVSGGRDGMVRLWHADGGERAELIGHSGPVRAVAVSPDGSWFASGGDDGSVRLWDADGEPRGVLTGHRHTVLAVAVSTDGLRLASAGSDATVRVWDVAAGGNCVAAVQTGSMLHGVAWLPGSGELLAGGVSGLHRFRLRLPDEAPAR
ncbi:NB-ARC domain-containing protein [Rhizohabitans arisaemae]|uniref:NB-ARC domain-containing protein n=1 Tax=Rhizohabitans arisaemae TaxID=2720610 RepID=UPI0024B0D52E|nr:NB-ARC domain-containing protein [Rhizohabitans arisaemae]